MQKTSTDPTAWLTTLPADIRADMEQVDALITSHLPTASRTLWEGIFWGGTEQTIIGYGDLTMTQSRGRKVEWFMVGLARQKETISIYVNAVRDGKYVTQEFGPRLGKAKIGASSISFRHLADLHLDVLGEVLDIANDQLLQAERA